MCVIDAKNPWGWYDILFAVLGALLVHAAVSFHLWARGRFTGLTNAYNSILAFDHSSCHW